MNYRTCVFCVLIFISAYIAFPAEENSPLDKPALTKAQIKELTALLPDPEKIGTQPTEPPKCYGADTLYEYIDGAAEAFLAYDFQGLISAQYKLGDIELTLDIYNMGTPLNAFGIYSAERSPDYDFIDIGVQASISEFGSNFLQQKFYVKISAFGPEAKIAEPLKKLAKAVSDKIGPVNSFPQEFQLLPEEHRIKNSEKFIRLNPYGFAFLSPTFTAEYSLDKEDYAIALTPVSSAAEAEKQLEALKQHFEKLKSEIRPLQLSNVKGWEFNNKYSGKMAVLLTDRHLLILQKAPEAAETILQNTYEYLQKQLKLLSQNK